MGSLATLIVAHVFSMRFLAFSVVHGLAIQDGVAGEPLGGAPTTPQKPASPEAERDLLQPRGALHAGPASLLLLGANLCCSVGRRSLKHELTLDEDLLEADSRKSFPCLHEFFGAGAADRRLMIPNTEDTHKAEEEAIWERGTIPAVVLTLHRPFGSLCAGAWSGSQQHQCSNLTVARHDSSHFSGKLSA